MTAIISPRSGKYSLRSMQLNFFSAPCVSLLALTVVGGTLGLSHATPGDLSDFKSPLDNSPMTFPLQTGEVGMPAVKNFKPTSVNEYRANSAAATERKKHFTYA